MTYQDKAAYLTDDTLIQRLMVAVVKQAAYWRNQGIAGGATQAQVDWGAYAIPNARAKAVLLVAEVIGLGDADFATAITNTTAGDGKLDYVVGAHALAY